MIGYVVSTDTTSTHTLIISSTAYGTTTNGDSGNYAPYYLMADAEELEKQAHAERIRRRNLGYLWQTRRYSGPARGRQLAVRFIPCWSTRRYGSRTGRPPRCARAVVRISQARRVRRVNASISRVTYC